MKDDPTPGASVRSSTDGDAIERGRAGLPEVEGADTVDVVVEAVGVAMLLRQ